MNKKKIGLKTRNYNDLVNSIDSSMKVFYQFVSLEEDYMDNHRDIDLYIVDEALAVNFLLKIDKKTPCLLINDDLKDNPFLLLLKIDREAPTQVFKNTYGDYSNISIAIRDMMEPNSPNKKSQFLFVIPVFNEEERINHVFSFIDLLLDLIRDFNLDARLRFVNDGSSDQSKFLIENFLPEVQRRAGTIQVDNFLEIIDLNKNTRKAGMYQASIKNSSANYYFFLDSDNSFFKEDIIKAICIIKEGYFDVIQATKDATAKNRSVVRKLLSFFKRICTYVFLPKGIFDSQTGFKIMTSNFAKNVFPYIKDEYGFAADLQMLNICRQLRYRALQLPVKCIEQEGSHVDPVEDTKKYLKSLLKIASTKEIYHDF